MIDLKDRRVAMRLSAGAELGPYRVVSLLGAGGMGEVYEAVDSRLDRPVAVKILPGHLAADPRLVARFEREARAVSRLSHPNVCTLHDVGEAQVDGDTVHYLVLELVAGETLEEVLAGGRLGAMGSAGAMEVEWVAGVAAQVAAALEAAHARGIAHRDLKPANVKVAPDGRVKVLDFGLAKALGAATEDLPTLGFEALPTRTLADTGGGRVIGTAGYMSPEQVRGLPADHRADIWAFGVLLFEMLAGRRPFPGSTISEALVAVLTERPDWSALPDRTPASLRRLLARCLEPDPTQRLQAIGEARIVLDRCRTASSAVPAHPDDEPGGGFSWKLLAPWAVAGMLAVALLGMLSARVTESAERRPLRVPIDLAPGETVVAGGAGGPAFALSRDGSRVVYVVGSGPETHLALRPLDRIEPLDLPGTGGAAGPFFSPDGTRVGFFAHGELRTVALAGGVPRTIAPAPRGRGGAWGPDGTIVFAPAGAGALFEVPADGGEPKPLTELADGERSHRWPSFLPDGRHVLFVDQRGTQDYGAAAIEVVDLETGERSRLIDGGTWPLYLATRPGPEHLAFVRDGTLLVVPFDASSLEVTGTPEPVLERVASSERAFGGSGSAQVAVSETGTLLYRSAPPQAGPRTVVERTPDGETTTLLAEPRAYRFPRLAPDGRRHALVFDGAVWVLDPSSGGLSRLTFDDERVLGFPVWTPDGSGVAYAATGWPGAPGGSDPVSGGARQMGEVDVYVRRTDGTAEARRLTAAPGTELPVAFSPDGHRLLYLAAGDGTGWDIRSVQLDGATPLDATPGASSDLVATPGDDLYPAISPDGKWLAYMSNETGRYEVYVRPFPDGTGRWQVSVEGGGFPRWTRNGRELVFRTGDLDDGSGLAPRRGTWSAVDVTADGDSIRAGKPREVLAGSFAALFPFASFDVARDEERWVLLRPEEPAAPGAGHVHQAAVHLVLDWFDDVARADGGAADAPAGARSPRPNE